MSLMRVFLLLVFIVFGSNARTSQAHPGPWIYNGYWGTLPWTYGFYNLNYWSFDYFNLYPWNYNYSYFGYFNFMPYYARYAAISYSVKMDEVGMAYGTDTKAGAVNTANRLCGQEDCATVLWVQGGCGALATNVADGRMGWALGPTKRLAIKGAVRGCNRGAVANGCGMRAWVCAF